MAILVAVAFPALIGLGALGVDAGYVFSAQRALQASADAAALAGAQVIGTGGTAITEAAAYGASGTLNNNANLTNATVTTTLKCFTSIGLACSTNQTPSCAAASPNCAGTNGANGIQVVQTAQVPTFFARIFGIDTVNISATASASMRGGVPTPLNMAIIVDTTASMGNAATGPAATACSGYSTAIACAVDGAQTLLGELWPWQAGATSGTSVDEAALFVFPPVTNAAQAAADISCTSPQIATSYSGVSNTTSAATTTSTLSLKTSMTAATEFNTGSPWAVVTDAGTPTNAKTTSGKTLTFPSGVITSAVTGLTVRDTTNPSAISSGTTVSSTTGSTTITLSINVAATVNSGDLITFGTSIPAGTGSWPWWGTGTTISSVTLPTTAVMSASPTGAGILQGDTIIAAPLYQIVGFANDYRTSDTASLNTSSNIVKITGSGCLKTPGGLGTYYADAISAAQNALVTEQAARVAAGGQGGTNVIVLLSDGNASSSSTQMGTLKSTSNECQAAVTAAQTAAAAGTKVYAVYYDDNGTSSTCPNDSGSYAGAAPDGACYTLQKIANAPGTTTGTYVNDPAKFYSTDGTASPCPSKNNYATIKTIFQNIATSLETARLIPNSTT